MGERIRVQRWLDDEPYPRADVEVWDDEPGDPVDATRIDDVQDRMVALFDLIGQARGAAIRSRDIVAAAAAASDPSILLYALASRVPMGQADRYAVLSAPTQAARLEALSEAVDTVTAMVEFQLSE